MPDVSAVREVFRRNSFCVIATASRAGEPWLSPVFFNYGSDFTIVWESAADALHSQYIRHNPRVAIFIKDAASKAPARDVYIEATAREVPAERMAEALQVWQEGPHGQSDRARRQPGDYADGKPLRLYEAQIDRLYILDETVVDDYRVDVRTELDPAELRDG